MLLALRRFSSLWKRDPGAALIGRMSKRQRKNSKYSDYVTGEEFSDGEQVEEDEDYAPKRSTPAKKRPPPKKKEVLQDPFIDEMNWMIVPPSLIWRCGALQAFGAHAEPPQGLHTRLLHPAAGTSTPSQAPR